MISNINNNESWSNIRSKLNEVIAAVNAIENIDFSNIETDDDGSKLVKGSQVIFKSATDNKYYRIDAVLFYTLISQGL